ncbi:MAG: hypothetical protein GXP62_04975, partial [Oligoflexia bacterium]|nr:hypothetical protein [Oligoflexia bacterium]
MLATTLLASALLASALLSTPAHADCDAASTVMWALPSTAKYAFAPDAVFRALIGQGESPQDAFSVQLLHNGELVPSSIDVAEHPGNSPFETRYLHTLVPDEPLVEGERYTFEVIPQSGDESLIRTVSTLVEADEEQSVPGVPELTVQSAYDDVGEGETSCDYGDMLTFELTLSPASSDVTERSVLHVYRMKSESDTWHYVRAYRVSEDASPMDLTLSFDRNLSWGSCFAVVQEDFFGNLSPTSDISCAAEPLLASVDDEPGPSDQLVDGSPRGCSTVGSRAGFAALWLAGLLGLAR